ncbi:uncharacterized protein LOC126843422 isoform X1 [Adelges cooleyi]|uniref:uncharacterized protein LOC126843422 isoform X1 n=1 Tax=Adelges cooleyi TaxID=133065 RepID=UPI00218072E7|nr:uncharacterized protein LOC126843422 isoform X1 [Adelges cooleyi]
MDMDINAVQIVDANDHNYNRVEDEIAVPEHLIEHNYYIPNVVQDNSDSEDGFDKVLIADGMLTDEDDEDQPAIEIQRPVTYKKLPGVHNKSDVYIDNLHYKYYKKSVYRNKMYLVCEKQRNKKADDYCPAKATIKLDDANNRIELQRDGHNHLPMQQNLEVPFVRPDTYRKLPGVHNKSDVYIDNLHYKYYKKSVYRNKMYLVCEKQRNKKANDYCPAKATITLDDANNRIELQHDGHNHLPVQRNLEVPRSKQNFIKMVKHIPYCGLVALTTDGINNWSFVEPPVPPLTNSINKRFNWNILSTDFDESPS